MPVADGHALHVRRVGDAAGQHVALQIDGEVVVDRIGERVFDGRVQVLLQNERFGQNLRDGWEGGIWSGWSFLMLY